MEVLWLTSLTLITLIQSAALSTIRSDEILNETFTGIKAERLDQYKTSHVESLEKEVNTSGNREEDLSLELISMSKELVSLITEAANYLTSADNENPQGADMQLGDIVSRKKRLVSGVEERKMDGASGLKTKRFFGFSEFAEGVIRAERNFVNAEEALLGYGGYDDGYRPRDYYGRDFDYDDRGYPRRFY